MPSARSWIAMKNISKTDEDSCYKYAPSIIFMALVAKVLVQKSMLGRSIFRGIHYVATSILFN